MPRSDELRGIELLNPYTRRPLPRGETVRAVERYAQNRATLAGLANSSPTGILVIVNQEAAFGGLPQKEGQDNGPYLSPP